MGTKVATRFAEIQVVAMENSFCVETRGEFGPHRDSVLRLPLHQFPIEGTKISEAGPPPSNRSSRGKHRRAEKQGVSTEWGRERSFVLREDQAWVGRVLVPSFLSFSPFFIASRNWVATSVCRFLKRNCFLDRRIVFIGDEDDDDGFAFRNEKGSL